MDLPAIGDCSPDRIGCQGNQGGNATEPTNLGTCQPTLFEVDIEKGSQAANGCKIEKIVTLGYQQPLLDYTGTDGGIDHRYGTWLAMDGRRSFLVMAIS